MGLRPLILETHLNFFWESGLGTTWLASTNRFAANGKEQIAIPSFAIGDERQIAGLGDDLGQSLHSVAKEGLIAFATLQLSEKTRGSLHQNNCPTLRFCWRTILMYARIEFIAFNDRLQKVVTKGIEHQQLLECCHPFHPAIDAVFGNPKDACHCIDAAAFVQTL